MAPLALHVSGCYVCYFCFLRIQFSIRQFYTVGLLLWPVLLQVDKGCELMGIVTKEMGKLKANIFRGHTEIRQDRAIMERFFRTHAECLFGYQYTVIGCPRGKGLPNGLFSFLLWSLL